MHPALAALTAIEAVPMATDYDKLGDWCDATGVPFTSETRKYIHELAEKAPPPPPPPAPHPRRTDTDELKELVRNAEKLPPMLKLVGKACLFNGLSLSEAAAHLRISRETVRVHLRRLRAINKMVKARRAAYAAREALFRSLGAEDGLDASHTERSRGIR